MPQQSGQNEISHARVFGWWRNLPAWESMSPLEKIILVEALRDCTLTESGLVALNQIRLTAYGLSKQHRCSQRTASKALKAIEERGWISRVGEVSGPSGQVGGVYELLGLTQLGRIKSGPFVRWSEDS